MCKHATRLYSESLSEADSNFTAFRLAGTLVVFFSFFVETDDKVVCLPEP